MFEKVFDALFVVFPIGMFAYVCVKGGLSLVIGELTGRFGH